MDKVIIIILTGILLLLVILNRLSISATTSTNSYNTQGNCSETIFGCCPDGINSRVNARGTNCPVYQAGPGYPTQPKNH
jgi:hypothetical protein